jgi:hypothetical protein
MTTASMTIKEPTHIMGPKGEIIATIRPINGGNGIVLDFDFENVEVKTHATNGVPDNVMVHLK